MQFPVLTIHEKQGAIFVLDSQESLCQCTPSALEKGWFGPSLLIIDSASQSYRIASVKPGEEKGRLFKGWFAPQTIKVTLSYTPDSPKSISLEEIKSVMEKTIAIDEIYWLEQFGDAETLKQKMNSASPLSEIMKWKF